MLAHDLRSVDHEDARVRLIGHRAGEEGLPGSRGALKEDSLWRIDPEPLKELRMFQRQLDHLAHLLDRPVEPDHPYAGILLVRPQRDRRGRTLAGDLDDRAFLNTELVEELGRNSCGALSQSY